MTTTISTNSEFEFLKKLNAFLMVQKIKVVEFNEQLYFCNYQNGDNEIWCKVKDVIEELPTQFIG